MPSTTQSPDAFVPARFVRQLTKKFTADRTERERGPDRAVRRDSYDIDDSRAQVFRPIGDGTKAGAMGWIDCVLQVAREYDDWHRGAGGNRPLGHTGVAVLEVLLGRRGRKRIPIDFKSGQLDPAYATIAAAAGLARITVIKAIARLKAHGFLSWVRRSRRTGNDGQFAPQRKQTSNAYHFDFAGMALNVRQRLRQLLDRKQRAQAATQDPPSPTGDPNPIHRVQSAELRATLDRIAVGLGVSTPTAPLSQFRG